MNFINQIINSFDRSDTVEDEGLRRYMLVVYKYIGMALFVTALSAFIFSQSPVLIKLVYGTPLQWIILFSPIFIAIYMRSKINTISFNKLRIIYFIYSMLLGVSLSYIFLLYTKSSIFNSFLVTASTFGIMSVYGHTTKSNLSTIRSYLFMALMGLLIAVLLNLIFKSSAFEFIISLVGLIIFMALVAHDTQAIRSIYYSNDGRDDAMGSKLALIATLSLYLNFINIFISILHIIGNRKE